MLLQYRMNTQEILRVQRRGRATAVIDRLKPKAQLGHDPARARKLFAQQLHIARKELFCFGGCNGMRNEGAIAAACGAKRNGNIQAAGLWAGGIHDALFRMRNVKG